MKKIVITEREAGQRLDKLLFKYLNLASKNFLYKMLRKKNILLNNKKADGSEKLQNLDEVKIYLTDETIERLSKSVLERVEQNLEILYEDDNILLVNKPAGMLSQKAKKGDVSLVEQIAAYMIKSGQLTEEQLKTFRPGICNRLDRNTSGLVIAGKSLKGLQVMNELLKTRLLVKYYLCIVKGMIKDKQIIKGYLHKEKDQNKVYISKHADKDFEYDYIETEYEPIQHMRQYTLLRVKLITGKSHQIRAHMASEGHPIIGDTKYGEKACNQYFYVNYHLNHQLLHANELIFPNEMPEMPELSGKSIHASLPDQFQRIMEDLI